MAKRKIIRINEEKCTGCGLCIPNCPEGALQIIDNKARLVSDLFCDGLGACLGHCPEDAITVEEREAQKYDEKKVMANIVKQGPNVIKAHLEHLKVHNETEYVKEAMDFLKENKIESPAMAKQAAHAGGHAHSFSACPGSQMMDFTKRELSGAKNNAAGAPIASQLRQWPIQIMLVPPFAPYLQNADLLIAADCVPYAYANFHEDLLRGKAVLVGCPKLDNIDLCTQKFTQIFRDNGIKSVTVAHMEVPCCFGIAQTAKEALRASGKKIPFHDVTINIRGERS